MPAAGARAFHPSQPSPYKRLRNPLYIHGANFTKTMYASKLVNEYKRTFSESKGGSSNLALPFRLLRFEVSRVFSFQETRSNRTRGGSSWVEVIDSTQHFNTSHDLKKVIAL